MMSDFLHRCHGVKGQSFRSFAINGGKFMFMPEVSLLAKELMYGFGG